MRKPIVFMFSGQGSQYYQMGRELYEKHLGFKMWMDHCDAVLSPHIGASLVDILYFQERKYEKFDRILYTNPALLCIEFSLARVLIEMDIHPDYLLGYSLGEITASVISGAVSLEDGIFLVVECAKLLEKKAPEAGMLAIIDSREIMKKYPESFSGCMLSGVNFNNSFVVSGRADDLARLQSFLNEEKIIHQRLPVNYGFHTELIDVIEKDFSMVIKKVDMKSSRITPISALRATSITEYSENYFWEIIRYPVDFQKTVSLMLQRNDYIFIDVGPSGTLATFIKYLLSHNDKSVYYEIINQFGKNIDSVYKLKNKLTGIVSVS